MLCYVLVCNERQVYPHLAYISLSMARVLHPGVRIAVLTDKQTDQLPDPAIRKVFDAADTLVKVDTPDGDGTLRSRYVKTSMRQLVSGDFIFLDADAIPIRPFMDAICRDRCFAAALDRNSANPRPHFPDWFRSLYNQLGWAYPAKYFNSGVVYFPDIDEVRRLGEEWHRRWHLTRALGCLQDQPALNSAIASLGVTSKVLPIRCNAMIDASPLFAWRALILHFYISRDKAGVDTRIHAIMERLLRDEPVDWAEEIEAFRREGPWLELGDHLKRHIVTGHWASALRLIPRRALRRTRRAPKENR